MTMIPIWWWQRTRAPRVFPTSPTAYPRITTSGLGMPSHPAAPPAITAKGAWESVKRHFREMGIDIQTTAFTVAGIGDMSGDVFGNGMLLSRHIRLLAAFDHRHIFLDPNPDSETSFKERERVFNLARSSWADYDSKLISAGGGVFPRSAKVIKISPEARQALGTEAHQLTPAELIRAILKAPVGLVWNGGIGPYVKSSREP